MGLARYGTDNRRYPPGAKSDARPLNASYGLSTCSNACTGGGRVLMWARTRKHKHDKFEFTHV